MKATLVALFAVVALLLFGTTAGSTPQPAEADSVGTTAVPLLSCPSVDGDPAGSVDLFNDIFGVAFKFGLSDGDPGYAFIYDTGLGDGTIDLFNDIFGVSFRFGDTCPLVDIQVAQATQDILNDPQAADLLSCNAGVLSTHGYVRIGSDVPGQGVHYVKVSLWDDNFDVNEPEGLVCQGGKLSAELYVVNGNDPDIGWGPFTPGGGTPIHSVDIDAFCTVSECSWDGPEGWHAHANLCILQVGTPSSSIIITVDAAACQAANGGATNFIWAAGIGWMGHLWNFVPNENLDPDVNGTMNGRFTDCRPPFKGESCPM